MAAGATYTPIATTTLGSATNSYTFSSIPSTYTDLILIANGGTASSGQSIYAQFNGDTASNYSDTILVGNGTSAISSRATALNAVRVVGRYLGTVVSLNNISITHFMNYSNTTTYKTVLNRSNNPNGTSASVSLWRSTSAISSMVLTGEGPSNILAGTTFTLYGIAAA